MTRIVNFVMELGFSLMGLVSEDDGLNSDEASGAKQRVSSGFKMGEHKTCSHLIVLLIG